jgi:hypothetical protein
MIYVFILDSFIVDSLYFLISDPENRDLMPKYNVKHIEVNEVARFMYTTNSKVRELYSFEKRGKTVDNSI